MLGLWRRIRMNGLGRSFQYALHELKRLVWNRWVLGSYGLEGEDLLIDRLSGRKKTGFYVDVGACHPTRFSNTKMFYDRGWRGINIDANPDLLDGFRDQRPRDINVNCGVGTQEGREDLYVMFPPTVSTFSEEFRDMNVERGCKFVRRQPIEILNLSSVLAKYLPPGTEIDFLSLDAEGLDFDVIKSNDWTKFRPKVICMESPTEYLESPVKNKLFEQYDYLKARGYNLAYHTGIDAFFVREN